MRLFPPLPTWPTQTQSPPSNPQPRLPQPRSLHLTPPPKTSAGTHLVLQSQLPQTPPPMPSRPALTCPTCAEPTTQPLFNTDGTRRVVVCQHCLTTFQRVERDERKSADLTSFPSLLEEVWGREVDAGQGESGVYAGLGRVLGFGAVFGRRGRKRSASASSGSSSGQGSVRTELE